MVVGAPQMISQPVFSIFPLFSTARRDLPNSRPVHVLMLSSHLFLCLPCLLPPSTMPTRLYDIQPRPGSSSARLGSARLARLGSLGSARAGRELVHLHLRTEPDLNQKFHVIVVPNASFFFFFYRSRALCCGHQIKCNEMRASLSPGRKPNQARLAFFLGRPSVNVLSRVSRKVLLV